MSIAQVYITNFMTSWNPWNFSDPLKWNKLGPTNHGCDKSACDSVQATSMAWWVAVHRGWVSPASQMCWRLKGSKPSHLIADWFQSFHLPSLLRCLGQLVSNWSRSRVTQTMGPHQIVCQVLIYIYIYMYISSIIFSIQWCVKDGQVILFNRHSDLLLSWVQARISWKPTAWKVTGVKYTVYTPIRSS